MELFFFCSEEEEDGMSLTPEMVNAEFALIDPSVTPEEKPKEYVMLKYVVIYIAVYIYIYIYIYIYMGFNGFTTI